MEYENLLYVKVASFPENVTKVIIFVTVVSAESVILQYLAWKLS